MVFDTLFWVALQSSLILGLVHGINPCGHSWLVLAPFVVGQKQGRKVAFLTGSFVAGTASACLVLGLTLGTISTIIPSSFERWVDLGMSGLLIVLGLLLLIKPDLLHHHDHDHDHHHQHDQHGHSHAHYHVAGEGTVALPRQKLTGLALFGIGFVNMIFPCPTVAIMYGYALDSGSALKATAIFAIYALTTAIAVGGVIYAIFRVARRLEKLSQDWVESALMRSAGVITIIFSGYSLYSNIA
ncbi:sulfite exporter TauE/SafE family protein [Pelobacter seleniigenes]|uniref:urease accessory protein UreH domain-containing protein n=1 Tax=Pelobacter seleniigenes TaxID=407188 RepID=UPI0004A7443A|nr:GAP family protein [Pelobacter seleniigenes]